MKITPIVGKFESNTFIVQSGDTIIIVDAGAPLKKLQAALDGRVPNAIFLTHEHFDHVFYLDDYKKAFACPVYAPTDETEIVVGEFVIKPLQCPGHSPQSVVYIIGDDLFTGDVLFDGTIGRTDLMPNGPVLMAKTLKKLLNVKFKTAHHGHYASTTYADQQKNIRGFLK